MTAPPRPRSPRVPSSRRSAARSPGSRREGCGTRSTAASRATASMHSGTSRISRRCSSTMRCTSGPPRTGTSQNGAEVPHPGTPRSPRARSTTPPASSWSGSSCRAGASHPGSTPIRWTMTGDGRRVRTTWRRGVRSRSRSWRWAPSMPPLLGAPSPSDSRRSPNGCTARQTGPIVLTVPIVLKRPIVLKVLKTQMGPGAVGLRRRAPLRTLLTLALLSPVLLSRAPIRWTRRVVQRRRGRRPRPARLGDSWPSGGPGARCRIATRSS